MTAINLASPTGRLKLDDAFLDRLEAYGPIARNLGQLIRPTFVARPWRTYVWGDWSAIEARVLPWLANSRDAERVLDIFRRNDKDKSLPDIYRIEAGNIFGKPPEEVDGGEERQTGKVAVLALGFGGGDGALSAMAANYGIYLGENLKKHIVTTWRDANPWARHFWGSHGRDGSYGLWGAINSAIEDPGTVFGAGRVAYVYDRTYLGGTLFCALPCGRLLSYPAIKWEWRELVDKDTGKVSDRYQLTYLKQYGRTAMWYGKACVAGDALVATSRGWVRLDTVVASDKLWDGEAWVSHDGLIYQGVKFTIPVDGVEMTPDHRVLAAGGWVEAQACKGLDRADVRLPDSLETGRSRAARKTRALGLPVRLWHDTRVPVGWVEEAEEAAFAEVLWMQEGGDNREGPSVPRHVETPGLRGVPIDGGSLPSTIASGMEKLRRARNYGLRAVAEFREFLGRHGTELPARADAGTGGQREGLLPGELHLGDAPRAGVEHSEIASVEHAGAVKKDGRSARDAAVPVAPRAVYDLLNAGPRSRFVVLGARGPFIVHNCENVTQAAAGSILRGTLKKLEYELADFMPTVGHTHDEAITEPPERDAEEAKAILKDVMEEGFEWSAGLPLVAEVTSNWYYSKAVK